MLDLRPGGQDQEREPVVAAVELQAEQVIDLAGVEQAGLEPPPGEPAEDVAQERRQVLVRRDDRPEDGPGHDPEGPVDLAGLGRVVEAGLLLDRDAQLLAERRGDGLDQRELVGSARRCRTSRVSSKGNRADADVTATAGSAGRRAASW